MTSEIFFLVIVSFFLNFSLGSMNYFGINRTFMLIYKGIFEVSLRNTNDQGESIEPYFDEDLLIKRAEEYFSINIPRYSKSYETSYLFFNPSTDEYCSRKYCRGVKISLRAKINTFFEYNKGRTFYVLSSIHE